jgi:hypothetical protein
MLFLSWLRSSQHKCGSIVLHPPPPPLILLYYVRRANTCSLGNEPEHRNVVGESRTSVHEPTFSCVRSRRRHATFLSLRYFFFSQHVQQDQAPYCWSQQYVLWYSVRSNTKATKATSYITIDSEDASSIWLCGQRALSLAYCR